MHLCVIDVITDYLFKERRPLLIEIASIIDEIIYGRKKGKVIAMYSPTRVDRLFFHSLEIKFQFAVDVLGC